VDHLLVWFSHKKKGQYPFLFYTSDMAIQFRDCDELVDVCDERVASKRAERLPRWLYRADRAGQDLEIQKHFKETT
jgi:hypothetical protein